MRFLLPFVLVVAGCGGEEGQRDAGSTSDAGDAGEPDARPDGGELLETGAPCTEGDGCVSGICLPDSLGGTCTEPCEHDPDCNDLDAVCLVLPDGDGFALGCGPPVEDGAGVGALCEEDGDCRNRRCECSVCGVPCVDGTDCVPGIVCTDVEVGFIAGTYRGCGFPARTLDPQLDEHDLGTETIVRAFGAASSDEIRISIPCDAVSLTVNALQPGGEEPLVIRFDLVEEPDGDLILDLGQLLLGVDQDLRNFPFPGYTVITMLVPNSTEDRLEILPGTYRWRQTSLNIRAGDPWPDTDVGITALVKRTDGPLDSGTLDLNVYPVGLGYTAEEAPDEPGLQETLATIETIYSQVEISLGDVTYYDIPAEEVGRLEVIDRDTSPDSELSDLWRLTADREGLAVNLFLVRSLSGILGIAGGVPGPAGLHGTARSGVVGVADPGLATPEQVGGIAAHEIAHYLGLYHSTSFGGEIFEDDPIADTESGDDTNLMWPASLNRSRILSEGQGFVLRRNPLVR